MRDIQLILLSSPGAELVPFFILHLIVHFVFIFILFWITILIHLVSVFGFN